MKLIWIRHGETSDNTRGAYLGHKDVPLNDRGREQARKTAEKLARLFPDITALYSSDLQRAGETAAIIAEACGQMNVQTDRALRELHFGRWDGQTFSQIWEREADTWQQWYQNPFVIAAPGGETLQQLGDRVDLWLEREMNTWKKGDTIVVVSHGGPIRWFQSRWIQRQPEIFNDVKAVGHGRMIVAQQINGSWAKWL